MARLRFSSITVEPFMFLCMMVFFLNLVALPQIILDNVCMRKHNDTKCSAMFSGSFKEDYDIVQEQSTLWFGGILVLVTFITVLTLPFVATLSDEFGRRKVMCLTPASQLVQSLGLLGILSMGRRFPTSLVLAVGAIPSLVSDVSGLYVFTSSYIADVTTEGQRTLRINLLEAASLFSGFVATISSGFIIESWEYPGICLVNIVLEVTAILYLAFFIRPIEHETQTGAAEDDKSSELLESEQCEKMKTIGFYDAVDIGSKQEAERNSSKSAGDTGNSQKTTDCLNIEGENQFCESIEFMSLKNILQSAESSEPDMLPNERLIQSTEQAVSTDNKSTNQAVERSDLQVNVQEKKTQSVSQILLVIIKKSNPIRNIKEVIKVFRLNGKLTCGSTLFLLMALVTVSYSGEMVVIVLYLKNHPYYLDARAIGFFLAFESGSFTIVGLVIFNYLFTRVLKLSDLAILFTTSFAYVLTYVLLGFATSLWMLYLIQVLHAIATLNASTLRAMLSKLVDRSFVGRVFAALLMVETASVLIGSILSPLVYSKLAATHPGAVFFVNAGLMLVCFSVSFYLLLVRRFSKRAVALKESVTL